MNKEKLETLVKDFTTYIQSKSDIETLNWLLKKRINPYQDNHYIKVDVYKKSEKQSISPSAKTPKMKREKILEQKIEEMEKMFHQDYILYGKDPLLDNKYQKLIEIKKLYGKKP